MTLKPYNGTMWFMERSSDGASRDESWLEERKLPRTWNDHVLPGYVVIAVDERDPDYPDQIVTNSDELPSYPLAHQLLRDQHYVRFLRLIAELPIRRVCGHRACVVFSRCIQNSIDATCDDVRDGKPSALSHLKRLLAIQTDYQSDPRAVSHKLN